MRAFSVSRSPAYLVRTPSSYSFRMIVPADIRGVVGSREIRYSLRTGSLREAKYKARKMAGLAQTMFRVIRSGEEDDMSQLLPAEMRSLLDQYLHEALEEDEYNRRMASRPMTEGQQDDHLESMSYVKSDLREKLTLNDYRGISRHVDDLLKEKGIELERHSESYRMLCREMLKVHIRLLEITQKRDVGDYSGEEESH